MAIRISLDLSRRDVRYFRDAVRRARAAVRDADEHEIVEAVRDVIEDIREQGPMPDFITGRLPKLEGLIRMLNDDAWNLPAKEREKLLATFVYFGDPEDLIPDDVPGIGYLDDMIVIELLIREMRHVSDAYADFCEFRAWLEQNDKTPAEKARRLALRRRQLKERMRRRRAADRERGRAPALF